MARPMPRLAPVTMATGFTKDEFPSLAEFKATAT